MQLLNKILNIYHIDYSNLINLKNKEIVHSLTKGKLEFDYSMFDDFISKIIDSDDIEEDYIIPGTNLKMSEFDSYIKEKRNVNQTDYVKIA